VEPEPLAKHTLTLPWWLMCGTLVKGGNYAPECVDAFEQTQARGGAGQVAALRVFVVLLASNAGDGNRDFIDPTTSGRANLAPTSRAYFRHVDAGGPASDRDTRHNFVGYGARAFMQDIVPLRVCTVPMVT
jgi:hypothetical protein